MGVQFMFTDALFVFRLLPWFICALGEAFKNMFDFVRKATMSLFGAGAGM